MSKSNDKDILNAIKSAERANNLEKYKTALVKVQFINELKNGLGDAIKENPSYVTKIEKKWYQKLGLFIKKLFTQF